jgi:peptidoglycan/xylan/chitin deacetylase (PgdA/CDA1 family)
VGTWLQETASFAIRWSGIATVVRRTMARRRASILLYHDPTPAILDAHFRYLAGRYNFVSLSALVDALTNDEWDSFPDRALAVTFDDGHRGNADLGPILRRYGVVPTVYLCSQIVDTRRRFWFLEAADPEQLKSLDSAERIAVLAEAGFEPAKEYPMNGRHALNRAELAAMAPHVEFASHTRFHPILTTSGDRECADEIFQSKHELEALLGRECVHFSYPNGDYSAREIALLRQAGYRSGRTVDLGWNRPGTDVYRLKILGTEDDASVNRLAADLTGITGYGARLRKGSFRGRHVQVKGKR